MYLKFKKLQDNAVLPHRKHMDDAGLDLTATSKIVDLDGNIVYGFGIAVEIPQGYMGMLFPRSSNANTKQLLTNSVGIIDANYRGEIMAKFKRVDTYYTSYKSQHRPEWEVGDRVCQLIVMPYPETEAVWADELTATDRGIGGYGSTGT